jgi:hypothetical protein
MSKFIQSSAILALSGMLAACAGDGEKAENVARVSSKLEPPKVVPASDINDIFVFTPSDPGTWSLAKRIEICEIYGNQLKDQSDSVLAFGPGFDACMTGKPQHLGMWAYQSYEMRNAGFMPSDPTQWSLAHRTAVCAVPALQTYKALLDYVTGAQATAWMNAIKTWCTSFGTVEPVGLNRPPPTGWDYADWEFAWWRKTQP